VTRAGRLVATAVAALALAFPSAAAADAVSGAELVALARQAADDAAARERLLGVDEVDGRSVDVRAALAGARGAELAARAELIAALRPGADAAAPGPARARAHDILDDTRYQGAGLPRPLAKPFAWVSDRIEAIGAWLHDRGGSFPGGPTIFWTVLSLALIAGASTITTTTIRRRAIAIERAQRAALPATDDPHALEREADRAQRGGDDERAVRLRFRAGLLRLDRRKVLTYRPSLTTGEVARAIDAPAFADVGTRFDEIAYGGRPAERDDAEAAERGWKDVLAQVARR
jgi:uncharacterized protein DUF4129